MKCSKCGKEFGNGTNCQYCGIDRVTGLGNYSGYDKPSGSSENLGNYSTHYASLSDGASNSTICYACGEVIPANSEYCPYCSKQLYVTCPKCGNTYSSQFPACNKCGTNRDVYYKQKEEEKQRALREVEEKQRKRREWEKSPKGKAKLARQRVYMSAVKLFGVIVIVMGIISFVLSISEQSSDTFEIGKALEDYGLAIALIIMGGCFLFAEKMD